MSTFERKSSSPDSDNIEQAKRRESVWGWGTMNDEFFREFGEPQNIRVEGENKIVLSYPRGEKTIDSEHAMASKHWEVSPSGQWEEDSEDIKAEFVFPDIPGAKVWKKVVDSYITPSLRKEFELLSEKTQQEILAKVREKILSPEQVAEKRFGNLMSGEMDYRSKDIRKLREDIRLLQAPGEMAIESHHYNTQEEITASYGDETWGTGHYRNVRRTSWSLVTGARKRERRSNWDGEYVGGHNFSITDPKDNETAQQFAEALMTQKRQQLKSELEQVKKINPPQLDPRLYTLHSEEWIRRYEEHWDKVQRNAENQWQTEDDEFIAEANQSWEEYERAAEDLREARKEAEQAERLARASLVTIKNNRPDSGNIGSDTVEQLQQQAAALRTYAAEINTYVPDAIKARKHELEIEEFVRAEEARQREAREKADIDRFGVSGRLLDTARSLAAEAEKSLGSAYARILFKNTCDARYGKAGRQGDIKGALGEDISAEAKSFYNFSRASDVNAVLYAVLKILEGVDVSPEISQPGDHSSASSGQKIELPEVKIEELPRLSLVDKKGWWSHELPNGSRHSNKLSRTDKAAYDAGERIDVRCTSCSGNPLVGYVQK